MKVEGARRNASASCVQADGQVCGGQVGVAASATTLASYTEAQLSAGAYVSIAVRAKRRRNISIFKVTRSGALIATASGAMSGHQRRNAESAFEQSLSGQAPSSESAPSCYCSPGKLGRARGNRLCRAVRLHSGMRPTC
jgi:hypothetical protein